MASDAERDETMRTDQRAGGSGLRHVLRIPIVTILALAVTAAILFVYPRTYESTARLILEVATAEGGADANARVASQVELIKAREQLLQVVDSENLRSVPEFSSGGSSPIAMLMRLIGMADRRSVDEIVLANLSERLTVAREGESSVISITARAGDPQLAASVANRLARLHVDGWAARQAADSAGAVTRLEAEIDTLRGKVAEADAAVASYKIEHGLADATGPAMPGLDQLTDVAASIAEAQQRKNNAETRAKVIRGLLETGEPLNGVAEFGTSPVMALLMQSRATRQAELTERQTTLLPNHPTIRALNAQIAQIEAQIRSEAGKIADSLEAEARIAAEEERNLRGAAATDQAAVGEAAANAVSLEGLERAAKSQRDLLDSYLATYSELEAASKTTGSRQDIRIISDAAPAGEPSSPNYLMVMAAVAFGAVALQLVALLFGRRNAVPVRRDPADDMAEMAAFAAEPEARPIDEMPEAPAGEDFVEEPVPQAPPATAAEIEDEGVAAISQDLLAQQQRVVLLASVGDALGALQVIERVLEDTIMEQLSAVVIDAASGVVTNAVGLTDLAAGSVDYGDVLQRVGENLAEVQWGRLGALDLESSRPLTLVEALAEIYHVVVVDTGMVGAGSNLPVFAGAKAGVLLVAAADTPAAMVSAARQEIAVLGFAGSRVVHLTATRAEVA